MSEQEDHWRKEIGADEHKISRVVDESQVWCDPAMELRYVLELLVYAHGEEEPQATVAKEVLAGIAAEKKRRQDDNG